MFGNRCTQICVYTSIYMKILSSNIGRFNTKNNFSLLDNSPGNAEKLNLLDGCFQQYQQYDIEIIMITAKAMAYDIFKRMRTSPFCCTFFAILQNYPGLSDLHFRSFRLLDNSIMSRKYMYAHTYTHMIHA